jgi:PAS domain S-box-containing protein
MPDQISQLIDQLAQLKREVHGSEESYRSLVDNLPLGVYRTTPGPRGELLMANAAFLKIFGYESLEQLRTVAAADLYADPAERLAFSNYLLENGRVADYELHLKRRDGSSLWGSITARVIQDRARDTLYFDCTLADVTEQHRVRQALRESEQRFRDLAESLPQVVFETDAHGQITFVNRMGYEVFGYAPDDIERGFDVLQTVTPADRERAGQMIRRIVKGEVSTGEEYLALCRDGRTFPVVVYSSPVLREGRVAGLRGFIIDITERKRVEAAEREQRTLAEALRDTSAALNSTLDFESVLDLILANVDRIAPCDCVSILLLSNDRQTAHSVRLTLRPGITVPEGGIHLPVDRAGNLRVMLETGQASIVANVHAYAEWVILPRFEWVGSHAGAPIRARGQIVGFLNLYSRTAGFFSLQHAHDLQAFADQAGVAIQNSQLYEQVQRYAAELEERVAQRTAELERERQRLQAILDTAGEGIVFTDVNGTIEYVNPAMQRLTGYTPDQALGHTPRLWSSSRTPVATYDHMWQTILHGDIWRGEVINRHQAGSLYDAAMIIAPLLDTHQQIIGFVALQRDITRQKELDRLKDQFVANVSHELRTPLANVRLYLGLLERGKSEKRAQYLQTLLRESGRLGNLIENLLSISRLDLHQIPIELKPTDVNQLIAQLVFDRAALINERGLLLENHAAADLPLAHADPALVIQIMSNLMTNATHYTPPGGLITLITACRSRAEREWVTLTVKDTGPGITAKDLPHLFERFYRGEAGRKSGAPGTGLGLAICREIAGQLGAEITVDSQPGHGAAFTVWLRPAHLTSPDNLTPPVDL